MNWFLIAFISALLSASAAVSQKKILFNMEAMDFVFWISLFNLLFSLPFFLSIDFTTLKMANLLILFGKSVLGAVSFLCIMYALKNLEISGALPLMVLTPGLVAIAAYFALGDALTSMQIAGIAMLMIGTYILEMKPLQKFHEPFKIFSKSKYYYYIGIALFLFTTSSIIDKLLLGKYKMSPMTFMAFQQLFYFIVLAGVYYFSKERKKINKTGFTKDIWLWLLLIAVLTVGYRYTQIAAIKIAPVAAVLAVKRISVFIAAIAGGKIFKESGLLKKTIAIAIMVAGAIIIMED